MLNLPPGHGMQLMKYELPGMASPLLVGWGAQAGVVSADGCMSRLLCCRQDALSASTALHSQVERLKGELATESTAIVHLRQNVSAAAQQEAQTVAQLQGQVCPALRASWMQAG